MVDGKHERIRQLEYSLQISSALRAAMCREFGDDCSRMFSDLDAVELAELKKLKKGGSV